MPFRPSPISSMHVARSGLRLGWPAVRDRRVWWTEDRPDEGGRTTIVLRSPDGTRRELLPAPWNARTRVHEYGGSPYTVTPAGEVVFANFADQRLYLLGDDGEPTPLTPEGSSRYADLSVHGGEVWCVREHHGDDGTVTRGVVSVPLDGGEPREHVTGSDFYASPSVSPDGAHLAYVCWNHPLMPWDGTELRVTSLTGGGTRTLAGGPRESVLAPSWRDASALYLVSDRSGWWNLYEARLDGTPPRPLHPAEEEFVRPPWHLGGLPYAVLGDGRLAVLHGRADLRLGLLDPATGTLDDLDLPYTGWGGVLAADGASLVGVGFSATTPRAVVRLRPSSGEAEELRRDLADLPDPALLPVPRPVRVGGGVHAFLYEPPEPDGPQPYVIFLHGGPTAHAGTELDLEKAFLTSRGIGVLDLNYGGSTGYGRAYRELLKGLWGVADVADTVAAAQWLAAEGLADPARIAVRGGSAGGWTVMASCCRSDAFAGGVSYFGVSALGPLAAHTHDFESRYIEWLVGPDPAVHAEREPLALAGQVSCPMLLLQGLDDPVVPPEQSEAFVAALSERGVPCTYLAFDGESHGFRRAETRAAALAAELAFYQQIFQ
ncbi:S9 family peptidase [Nonomuraea pusilla]|uniref:Dipeptidyl aminopeptidase/acylaminoacyl peptidase n=1 Tax=Nonomuraea pusilla TaxID=46177 RepID=A0A1H7S569_9ACTN|nr:prolyl oligopeptidase family serine peptidase [Nonomuraea pusilla]SEL67801.1 Dipeptidyl aminopeptidase/acylaminoacyl peptidase [Nonomuraea pusilla]